MKSNVTKYEEYKVLNVDWIKEVPKHWQLKRIKDMGEYQSGEFINAEDFDDENQYPVYGGNGFRGLAKKFNHKGEYILIGRQGALCGNINYANGKFWATEHAVVVYKKKKIDTRWYGELLKVMNLNRHAISAAQPGLSVEKIKRLEIIVPPLDEQIAISQYISTKTEAIDKQIGSLEKKILLYKELTLSLIQNSVLRGLNKNVELRPSGVEWIGEIPCHWKIERAKDVFYEVKAKSKTGSEDLLSVSEYYGVARKSDVVDDDTIALSRAESLEDYKLCRKGDLVINIMLAWKMGLGITEFDGIVSPSYAVYRQYSKNVTKYYHYLLRIGLYTSEFKKNSKGIIESRLRLYSDSFYNVPMVVPPIEEQKQIVEFLETRTKTIEAIVKNISKQIITLKEYKKTLVESLIKGEIKPTN